MKKLVMSVFLICLLIVGFELASISNFGLSQTKSSFKVSGYILDSAGRGIAGAEIIFGVPDVVPAVYSNSSGYYVLNAPAGVYHVNVWPPFDSNYIYYDLPVFVVGTDIAKNVTLTTGYKISGYITDSLGTPVSGAVVSLNSYLSGWFSQNSGYYFVSAPAGTYTLTAQPRSGYNHFPTTSSYNFVVNNSASKNITLTGPLKTTPTPSQTPSPTLPPQNLSGTSYRDDFSTNSGLWTSIGTAYRDPANQYLVLTEPHNTEGGAIFFQVPFTGTFTANFSYKVGGGSGGDGFTLFFYKQKYSNSTIGEGGSLGFSDNSEAIPGYGIEFDGWQNLAGGEPSPPREAGDPSGNHIALIKDWYGNHIVHVDDVRTEDNIWHNVSVVVGDSVVGVFVDGEFVLRWDGALDRTYSWLGFSGGTGGATNWHIIDNFSLTASVMELPSTPTRTNVPGPAPMPPRASALISISADESSPALGSTVNINGRLLDKNGHSLGADKTVILSYAVGNSESWFPIGSGNTNTLGEYSIQWVPGASGTFTLRTDWSGDSNYTGTSNSTTVSFLPYQNQKVFCVESNSTVTGLEFNDSNLTLGFTVSGLTGTIGYTRVTIAKSLVPDITGIATFVDEKTVNFTTSSANENWIIEFTYSHSTHIVNINLTSQEKENAPSTAATPEPQLWLALLIIAVSVVVALAFVRKKQTRSQN